MSLVNIPGTGIWVDPARVVAIMAEDNDSPCKVMIEIPPDDDGDQRFVAGTDETAMVVAHRINSSNRDDD